MKPALQLRLSQYLTLTPQLQQSIRLLQLSTLELSQEIERMVQENPLLELDDGMSDAGGAEYWDISPDSRAEPLATDFPVAEGEAAVHTPATEGDIETGTGSSDESDWFEDDGSFRSARSDDGHEFHQQAVEPFSLREYLNSQINLSQVSERNRRIVGMLVDGLDDDGYFTQDLEELVSLLPPELEISFDDLHSAIEYLQQLDPPGIGARNLAKCLALQLRTLPAETPHREQALLLVSNHLESLASRDFRLIKKLLHCDDDCLRSVQHLITHLNPRPGAAFNNTAARYIVPDVIVTKSRSAWVANLNPEAMPRLKINHLHASILKHNQNDTARRLVGQLNEASWLIKNVKQRFDTILRVLRAIVERQRQFFEHGSVAMRTAGATGNSRHAGFA